MAEERLLFADQAATEENWRALRMRLAELGCVVSLETTHQGHPHLHLRHRDHRTGTLELTFRPGQILAHLRPARTQPWVLEVLNQLPPGP